MSIIKLIHGSCVDQKVDAIVNAANKELLAGSGVCGAIFSKAGYEKLSEACSRIKTPLNDGEAVITSSFNIINAKNIIHTVGPNFALTPNAYDKLFDAYYNSMKLMDENALYSIAFPLISSGVFCGNLENPVMESTKQCIEAYYKYNQDYRDSNIMVLLCAYTDDEYTDALNVFKAYKIDNLEVERCRKLNILTDEDIPTWGRSEQDRDTIVLAFPNYNENVMEWIKQMYTFNLVDLNYQDNYNKIKNKGLNELSIDEILTMFTCYIRGEHFGEGIICEGIKDGTLVKLSKLLKELCEDKEK